MNSSQLALRITNEGFGGSRGGNKDLLTCKWDGSVCVMKVHVTEIRVRVWSVRVRVCVLCLCLCDAERDS